MLCPQCGGEYHERLIECPDCHVPLEDWVPDAESPRGSSVDADLDVLIRTSVGDPVAISLVRSLFQEAGITFFEMDQSPAPRQESGNFLGWWSVRVPRDREAEAREILQSVEQVK